jgi:undecaprenyl-diphosphatase
LLVTGSFLFATRFARGTRGEGRVGLVDAILIGLAQAAAIFPGISRSGATISTGLFLGVDRARAARFSFLLFIPAVGGAGLLELRKLSALPGDALLPVLVGGVTAAVVGLAALLVLLRMVTAGKLHWFSYYCWAAGGAALVWLMLAG